MIDDVWSFAPEEGSTDTLDFLTDVLRTYNAEQRIKLRKNPRRKVEYNHLCTQEQFSQAKLKARRYGQTGTMYVPLWSCQKQIEGILFTDTVLSFGATDFIRYYEYNVNDKVIIWNDWDDYIVRDITSFDYTNNEIVLSSAVGTNLTRAIVMPLRAAVALRGFTTTQDSPNASYIGAEWTLKESTDVYTWVNYDFFGVDDIFEYIDIFQRVVERYNGIYVRKDAPYRMGSVLGQILQPVEIIDNKFGPIKTEPLFDYVNTITSVEFFWNTPAERAAEVRDFFGAIGGRLTSFYLPTFSDDVVPLTGVYTSTTTLSVVDYGLASDYAGRAIMIELNDGTKTYNTIDSAVDATSEITLTLNTAITLDTADLKRISFMNLVRADEESFVMSYSHGRGGTVRFNVIEVPN